MWHGAIAGLDREGSSDALSLNGGRAGGAPLLPLDDDDEGEGAGAGEARGRRHSDQEAWHWPSHALPRGQTAAHLLVGTGSSVAAAAGLLPGDGDAHLGLGRRGSVPFAAAGAGGSEAALAAAGAGAVVRVEGGYSYLEEADGAQGSSDRDRE
jgi:hypothetical protein